MTEGIPAEQRGSISSFYNSTRFIGVAVGPPLFALFMKGSHLYTFVGNALLILVTIVLVFWGIRPQKKRSERGGNRRILFYWAIL
ncbi:siderophore transport protein [Bacillus sp. JCM 19046]|nr:siderophore transport protein [Bacillus sp. JCM 19045]GAF15862.1 siderophore transport protein [Bacillus sp. JCM 19046]